MKPILPLPLGSDLTIIEVIYYDQYSGQNTHEGDVLTIVYVHNNEKKVHVIKEPEMEVYFTRDEYKNEWKLPREWVPEEKLEPVSFKFRNLLPSIYRQLKNRYNDERTKQILSIYEKAIECKNFNARKEIHKHHHVFFSDIPITDYYRIQLSKQYNTEIAYTIRQGFLDIEADMHYFTTEEAEMGVNPVNAISYIVNFDPKTKELGKYHVFTFLLRDYKMYPQQEYFEKNIDKFIDQCHNEFDSYNCKFKKQEKKYNLTANYTIRLFDKEEDMIEAIFKVVNATCPDFLSIFNIAYDIPKLKLRLDFLYKDARNVMCHPSIPESIRIVKANVDDRPGIGAEDRKTAVTISGLTKYVDLMILGASSRKGRKSIGGDGLDTVANFLLGAQKKKFKPGVSVFNAAVYQYWEFVLYSINDVWLMVLIEMIAQYIQTAFYDSNSGASAVETIVKKTVYLRNADYLEYWRMGFIHGNNVNNDYIKNYTDEKADALREMFEAMERRKEEKDEEDDEVDIYETMTDEEIINYEEQREIVDKLNELTEELYNDSPSRKIRLIGAIVGDPLKKSFNGAELIKGQKSRHVFVRCEDKDYTAMYPTAQATRSMSRSGEYGRLIIPNKISKRQNEVKSSLYLPGGEYIRDLISDCVFSFMNVWYGMKTFAEYVNEYRNWRK